MTLTLSKEKYHGQYCIITNPRTALVLVLSLALVVCVSWNGLRKPIQHIRVLELLLYVLVAAIFVKCLVIFRCFRERLIVGLALTSLAIGGASGLVPVGGGAFADLIKYGKCGLWTFALLISISALISSARRPYVPDKKAVTVSPSRGLLVLSIVLVIALLLGALMYFIPLR